MRMKKKLAVASAVLASVLALGACSSSSDGSDSATDESTLGISGDTIKIGIKFDQPGLGLKDGDTYKGFDVDVAKYVANKLGYDDDHITWVEAISAQRETLIQNGSVDLVFATYSITDARKEQVSFAGPYFIAGQDFLVSKDNTDITGPNDLGSKILCSVEGSISAERIRDDYSKDVQLYPAQTYSECVELLAAGSVDAVTTDDIILAGFAAQEQYADKFKIVGNPFTEEKYGVGLKKGNTALCEAVNDALTEMFTDGSWEKALSDNTPSSYTPNMKLNPPEFEGCDS
ncbi:MAG: glutamate ABC transporter substrate-binding protein [Ancrocorticia sp.]|jgi:amino acid ABC transporter substrate-binding protein, PAAT family (TC 3.A.1.3.-)|nr:glutamate ABC transporter substrate-binding protein [Ancrocorticia sp.]MCI2194408.1 glutamate ABC transporter substrate-binding protein [Ancrocorticia sp.]MCI2199721.1 glutamate ABC transporter substrate-binding protein [Ancrocorticia sp.]